MNSSHIQSVVVFPETSRCNVIVRIFAVTIMDCFSQQAWHVLGKVYLFVPQVPQNVFALIIYSSTQPRHVWNTDVTLGWHTISPPWSWDAEKPSAIEAGRKCFSHFWTLEGAETLGTFESRSHSRQRLTGYVDFVYTVFCTIDCCSAGKKKSKNGDVDNICAIMCHYHTWTLGCASIATMGLHVIKHLQMPQTLPFSLLIFNILCSITLIKPLEESQFFQRCYPLCPATTLKYFLYLARQTWGSAHLLYGKRLLIWKMKGTQSFYIIFL